MEQPKSTQDKIVNTMPFLALVSVRVAGLLIAFVL